MAQLICTYLPSHYQEQLRDGRTCTSVDSQRTVGFVKTSGGFVRRRPKPDPRPTECRGHSGEFGAACVYGSDRPPYFSVVGRPCQGFGSILVTSNTSSEVALCINVGNRKQLLATGQNSEQLAICQLKC